MKRVALLLIVVLAASARAQATRPSILADVGIDQKLDVQVDPGLAFTDDAGATVHLGDYFGRRPIVLSLVYYQCPMLCTMSLNDLTRTMGAMPLKPGEDFDIVTVSFDPREKSDLAAAKKRHYVQEYRKPRAAEAWHFLVGDETSIRKLTDAVGFRYAWDAKFNQYAHAAGFIVLTPEGKTSRYFYGVDYSSKDLRLAIDEASHDKISRPVEQILLYCFHYDPSTGRYSLAIMRLMQTGGVITLLALGGYIALSLRRDARRRAEVAHG